MPDPRKPGRTPEISSLRRWTIRLLVPVWLVVIHGVPAAILLGAAWWPGNALEWVVFALLAPIIYLTTLPLVAGLLSRLTLFAMVPGRFPRDLGHRIYGPRRLHGLCWTSIYYNPPVYHLVLALPWLRRVVFRLFGYRGATDFALYPDTWIRDLPLLSIGSGAYLSNRSTISPNMCLKNGTILVAPVEIGAGSLIGHAALIAPGVVIEPDVEIGVQTAVNVGARIGNGSRIGHCCSIDRRVDVGPHSRLAERTSVGARARVEEGATSEFGRVVPARGTLRAKTPQLEQAV